MKKILLLFCISLLINITWAQERSIIRKGEAGLRFALVIGNADYQQTAKLRNPVNDVRAINSTLSELGFTVTALENADQRQMENAIRKFGKTLRTDRAIGLFYYAGHGMQIDGENYLLPVEANPTNEDDVRYDGVPVGKLLGQMKNAGNSMNVVILDACRNNPFTRNFRSNRRGLAQVTAPTGTFISYATAPGGVAADGDGKNGLYTEKLISHMLTPGLKLEEVFKKVRADVQSASNGKQVPWDSSSVTGDFYFASLETKESQKYVPNKMTVSKPIIEAPPETSGLQLKELTQLAKSQEQAKEKLKDVKKQWSAWQSRMQKDYNAAQNFENRDITPDIKIEPWRQFLEAYASNNPFGKKDEALRIAAQERLKYWRSETKTLSKKNNSLSSNTEVANLSDTPQISAPPTNPDAEKIWNKYQLGLKRNLPKLAEKYLQKILAEHPESSYAIQIKVEELNAPFAKSGLTTNLIEKIEKIRSKHPRNSYLRELIVQAAPILIKLVDKEIREGRLEAAEDKLNLAANWNISDSEISPRHKQIQQIRISSLIKESDNAINQGMAINAEQKLNVALRLGAEPTKIEKLRRGIPLKLANFLIESDKFEKAGELLLELELEGDYALEIPELYRLLYNKKNQFKWDKILALIEQKEFSDAEFKILEWGKKDDAPENLPKLKDYLQQEKTGFTEFVKNEAKGVIALNQKTGFISQNIPRSKLNWSDAKDYCIDLSFADFSDWRLPNINDLRKMFEKRHNFTPIEEQSVYWSSDINNNSRYTSWFMDFASGNFGSSQQQYQYSVRCVRGME